MKKLLSINENDTMREACQLMIENSIRHLPVVNNQGTLMGILSERDVEKCIHASRRDNFRLEQQISETSRVKDFMNWPVYTISEDTPLEVAAEEMLNQKVSCLVILDKKGQLTGIVTTDDILQIFVQSSQKNHYLSDLSQKTL